VGGAAAEDSAPLNARLAHDKVVMSHLFTTLDFIRIEAAEAAWSAALCG
jgi:hypothetical protein